MMTNTPIQPKRIVLRANRDTAMLVAGAIAATLALAASIHARSPDEPASVVAQAPQQDWTGDLADIVQTSTDTATSEPLTSASLTVPKSAIALPNAAVRPKAKPCDGPTCSASRAAGPHGSIAHAEAARATHKDRSLMARLNPLNHLDTLQKPFVYAGNTISSWLRSF